MTNEQMEQSILDEQNEKAVKIVNYLVSRGHFVDFDVASKDVTIKPMPEQKLVDRVLANEAILVEMFRSLDGRPATNHLFVVSDADLETDYAMCIACGVLWWCHGEPDRARWVVATEVDRVVTRDCAPLPVKCECGIVAA